MMWRDPKKKCIAKRCDQCQLLLDWDYKQKDETIRHEKKCLFQVWKEEKPKDIGLIIGAQKAANEARNRANEVKTLYNEFLVKINETLQELPNIFANALMEQVKSARSGLSDTTDRRSQQRLADQSDTPE